MILILILAAIALAWILRVLYRHVFTETLRDGIARIDAADLFIIRARYDRDRMSDEDVQHWSTSRWD
jgi:hypothetical protein